MAVKKFAWRPPCLEKENNPMWSCPTCRSKVKETVGVCESCGTSRAGDECPSRTQAGAARPIPAAPGTDPDFEPQSDLPELVECFSSRDQADAALMAQYLEERGIATRLMRDTQAVTGQLMYKFGRVLIRPKDIPRAGRLMRRIQKRRAQRERRSAESAEYPWEKLAAIGVLILPFCTVIGALIGVQVGDWPGWDRPVCGTIGGIFGCIIGLSLIIWVFRLRTRADAMARAEKATSAKFE